MNTKRQAINPQVLGNLTKGMGTMKQLGMELLNQGKDRSWAYPVIWALWLIFIPCVEVFCIYMTGKDELKLTFLLLNPAVYAALLLFYVKVKVWEKEHLSTWEEISKKHKGHCILLNLGLGDSFATQIERVEKDLAGMVDFLIEAQEIVKAKKLELRQMIRAGDNQADQGRVKEEIEGLEAQIEKSQDELGEKIDNAAALFAGDFKDTEQKYRNLFGAGSQRFAMKAEGERRTFHPFALR